MVIRDDCELYGECNCSCITCRNYDDMNHCRKHEDECHIFCRDTR